jgi:hypothetical protein
VLTTTISSGCSCVADALELGLHLGGGHHVTVGQMAEVELHARLEAPFQRHLVDGDGRLLLPSALSIVEWKW